jgi:UTP--glucose-1-phosphate uridylyltransferase
MANITKAIILTAGYGTRRLPITKTIDKNMLPLCNRPVIDYVVEECVLAGITDIYMVVNNAKNSQIKDYYGSNDVLERFLTERGASDKLASIKTAPQGVNLHFVEQNPNDRYGTAVAVALAVEEFGLAEQVVLCNGDDPFWGAKDGSDVKTLVKAVERDTESAIMGYQKPHDEVPAYGMLKVKDGFLTDIIEKPALKDVTSNLVNINRLVMAPQLLNTIVDYVNSNDFGPLDQEYIITDAYAQYLKQGGKMRVVQNTGQWLDTGSLEGWLQANNIVFGA